MDDLIARACMIGDHLRVAQDHAESLERDIELNPDACRTGSHMDVRQAVKLLLRAVSAMQSAVGQMEAAKPAEIKPVALPVAA